MLCLAVSISLLTGESEGIVAEQRDWAKEGREIWEKIDKRLDEGTRGAAALNGAGVAAVVGILRSGIVSSELKAACVLFVIGVIAAIVAWMVALVGMNLDTAIEDNAQRRLRVLMVSITFFVVGVVMAVKATVF